MTGPSPENVIRNWKDSDDPFFTKLGKLIRNNTKKVVTLSHCCGHPGEPGC